MADEEITDAFKKLLSSWLSDIDIDVTICKSDIRRMLEKANNNNRKIEEQIKAFQSQQSSGDFGKWQKSVASQLKDLGKRLTRLETELGIDNQRGG